MRAITEIKKVEQKDLQLFLNALNHYAGTMQFLMETMDNSKFAIEMSIAVEMWYEFKKKTIGQFPPKYSLLKLSVHKSYILCSALREYARVSRNDLEKSRSNRFSMVIDQQLPTRTQLALNN